MFNPSRDQVRRFFCDAWQKDRQGLPLVGAETIAVDLIRLHPEYHALLADVERALSQEWTPEEGQMNPFLHLSLHLAVEEQISIDHPRGIREAFHALACPAGRQPAGPGSLSGSRQARRSGLTLTPD